VPLYKKFIGVRKPKKY
jgi:activating signal cointegrator complex subunit 3